MDHLWSPWRYRYVSTAGNSGGCVFCEKLAADEDRTNYILLRAEHCFVVLNLYPYTTGHLMVIPYAHVSRLEDVAVEVLQEMMGLAAMATRHLQAIYKPGGFNIGMNVGECAGAGIAGHIHLHVLPRWPGDVNFMTSISDTRVLPELLETTYEKLHQAFHGA